MTVRETCTRQSRDSARGDSDSVGRKSVKEGVETTKDLWLPRIDNVSLERRVNRQWASFTCLERRLLDHKTGALLEIGCSSLASRWRANRLARTWRRRDYGITTHCVLLEQRAIAGSTGQRSVGIRLGSGVPPDSLIRLAHFRTKSRQTKPVSTWTTSAQITLSNASKCAFMFLPKSKPTRDTVVMKWNETL